MKGIIAIICLVISLAIFFASSFYSFYYITDVKLYGMKAEVGDIVGLDVNATNLAFGIILPGGSGERHVIIKNNRDIPLNAYIKKSGEMASWVYVTESSFMLAPGEEKDLAFSAVPGIEVPKGKYSGKVRFIFTRVF